ncbi:MAG: LysR family transcriptional regulator [Burkholderiaceae bacterium]
MQALRSRRFRRRRKTWLGSCNRMTDTPKAATGRSMDRLVDLEAFVLIVEHRSMSAAARVMGCSPSAMSKMLSRLEDRLAVRLMNRTSRAVSLTPEGELLYQKAIQAIDSVRRVEESVAAARGDVAGVLRIATSLQVSQFYLAPLVPEIRKRYPRMELQFFLRPMVEQLVEHQIDVALFPGEPPSSSYIARRIAPIRWVVCASPEYLSRSGTPQHPRELLNHECLNFLPGEERVWPFRIDGEPYSIAPTGSVRVSSGDLMRVFARLSLGIARLPIAQIRSELDNGELVIILHDYEETTPEWLYAIYHSERHLSPRAVAFLRFLDNSFRDWAPLRRP